MSAHKWIETLLSEQSPGKDFESPVLLAADADRVTEYVFETPGLPEMQGASTQLKRLNLDVVQQLLQEADLPPGFMDESSPGCLIYAAGGGLLALVPASKADALRTAIERVYPEQTGVATTTCVRVDTSWEEVHTQFGPLFRRAGRELRARKQAKESLPFFEVLPFFRRCDACRKRPATEILRIPGEAAEFRCRACAAKRTSGRQWRSEWHDKLSVVLPEDGLDLEKIAGAKGYIGVVYADGNGLGDWLEKTRPVMEFRERSQKVSDSVGKAVEEALQVVWNNRRHLFEVLLVGGDDVLLIVPAGDALPVAHTLCRRFEQEMRADQLTMSAGVVIAEHHTPVYFLRRLAADLLKSAKRDGPGSKVDFLVLKGQGTRSAEQARERVTLEPETLILNHGPYTLDDLIRLLKDVHQGKAAAFPPSQLYALKDTLKEGRQASALAFLYAIARARDEHRLFLEAFANAWFDETRETPPWHEGRPLRGNVVEYRTPWADLVDVWDFVE